MLGRRSATSLLRHCTAASQQKRFVGLVPVVLESGALGERSFDIYSRLLRERIICVHGEITDQMASVVTAQLLFLEAEAPEKPLYMYINSPGGLVTAGMVSFHASLSTFDTALGHIYSNMQNPGYV